MNKNDKKSSDFFLDYMKKQQEKAANTNGDINNKESSSNPITSKIIHLINFVMELINNLLYSLLANRKTMALLALVLAIIFYVSIKGEDQTKNDVLDDIEVIALNLSDDYIVEGIPDTTSILVQGTSLQLQLAKLSNCYVYVDLSGYQEGSYSDISYSIAGLSGGATYRILTDKSSIDIYKKESAVYPLTYKIINEDLMNTDKVLQKPKLSLDSVTVYGKESDLERISTVAVEIDLDHVSDSTILSCPFKAYDQYDNEITTISFDQKTLNVDLKLADASKQINIKPIFIGLNDNQAVSSISYNISALYYYGSEKKLEQYSELKVEINLANMDENGVISNINLDIPSDVDASDTTLQATVTLESKTSKTFTGIPVEIRLPEGNESTVSTTLCTVKLVGSATRLNSISIEDISCYVAVTDLSVEDQTLPVNATCTDNLLTCEVVSPVELSVNVHIKND